MNKIYWPYPTGTKMLGKLALSLLLVADFSRAATTWYVSTTGSDSNSGTSPTAPLRHVQTAVNGAQYGDTINIQAGVYREQVLITNIPAGSGSSSNMLTIQAWDTNGDGIIESNEVPTLNSFQLVTNWTALTDTTEWTKLTGNTNFQPNTIFYVPWSTNESTNYPIELVMESPSNALQCTSWVNTNHNTYPGWQWPQYMPTNMYLGTFQYDYVNHVLYVWRSDGNVPGSAYPVEAPYMDTNSPWPGPGLSPLVINGTCEYFHIKNLNFRYENANPDCVNGPGPGVFLGYRSVIENCDVEWMAWAGLGDGWGVVSNCTISNNGETGLMGGGSNAVITGCTFVNNGWRHYWGDLSEGAIYLDLQPPQGFIISNNIFINNYGDAIHMDHTSGTSSNPIVIVNNFIGGTNCVNGSLDTDTIGGIFLELSSHCYVANNVIATPFALIYVDGGSWETIVNNTLAGFPNPYTIPDGGGGICLLPDFRDEPGTPFGIAFNVVANNITVSSANSVVFSVTQDSTNANATPAGPLCYSNVYANNILWNYLPTSQLSSPPIQVNVDVPPYTNAVSFSNNLQAFEVCASGTDEPFQDVGNTNVDPLFFNFVNTGFPTNANYYTLRWDNPARNAFGAVNYGVANDYAGNPRGIYPDLGAYQAGLLFWDNFAHSGTLAPWVDETGSWSVSGGELEGSSADNSYGHAYITNTWADYFVLADIQFSSTNGYGGGLAGRLNPSTGTRYAAYVYPENSPVTSGGVPLIRLVKFDSWTTWGYNSSSYTPMAQTNLASVGTSWHSLKLAFQGKQITVYFDGVEVLSAADDEASTYFSGGVGVDLYTGSASNTLAVSNVDVESFSPWVPYAGQWAVTGELLQGTNALGGNYGNAYLTNVWTNYTVQGNVQFSTTSAYGAGLAGRLNPATGTRYAAYIYPEDSPASGAPKLRLVKFDSWNTWGYDGTPYMPMVTDVGLTPGSVGTGLHNLQLTFQGTNITVYLDGTQKISTSDTEVTTYPTGGICTDMYSDAVHYTFSVTNVTVNLSP